MEKRSCVSEIKIGKVFLQGWCHELRDLAKIKFILLRDTTGIVQCVLKDEKLFKIFNELTLESVIELEGKVNKAQVESNEVSNKNIEIEVTALKIINKAEKLPILVNKKIKTDLSKKLDYRSIDLRKLKNNAIFKIQAALVEGMQKWLNNNGFVQVFTPCLMGAASESGSDVFQVAYFDKRAFLRQDPQLHRQLTILGGLEKIYDIGPSWRAEKSHTVKHLTEHRTCAVELAFISSEQDTMRVEEQIIISALKNILEKCKNELEILGANINIPKSPFPELKFPEIYKIIKKSGKKIEEVDDLDTESEKILWKYVQKKYKTEFYFINKFPFKLKPFYVYHDNEYARSVDLYCKGLELSSGGQREHRYDVLIKNLKEKGISEKSIEWFTKFFKWGAPPHGGFALGIERLTQIILGLENIRDAVLFPRDPKRLVP